MRHCPAYLFCVLIIISLAGCSSGGDDTKSGSGDSNNSGGTTTANNILFIVMDDVGNDQIKAYGVPGAAITPAIDQLAKDGIVFRNAWACPTCSATRACLYTGQYPYRTGIGYALLPNSSNTLATDAYTIPRAMVNAGLPHRTAMFGKWHVSHGASDPNIFGYQHFSGIIEAGVDDYYNWQQVTNGVTTTSTNYITTQQTDEAIAWIAAQGDAPWFVTMNYIAAHDPMQLPPAGTYSNTTLTGTDDDIDARERDYFQAIIENLDYNISRLVTSLGATRSKTTIIILGDNGTQGDKVIAPYVRNHAKGTLYQGGVQVPLIISGAGIAGQRHVYHLVHVTDLYSTCLELMGGGPVPQVPAGTIIDGRSFAAVLSNSAATPPRSTVFTEQFGAQRARLDGRTVRDDAYKLIVFTNGNEEFYDLRVDPYERNNLLANPLSSEAQSHYQTLKTQTTNPSPAATNG